MIPILYPSDEVAFATNGLARLYDCTSCEVVEERNGLFECNFDYPVTGAHFNDILLGRIIAATHDDTGEIQPFDIVSCTRPINGVVSFHAVHVSYRLSKKVAVGSSINSLHAALAMLASAAGTPFVFTTNMEDRTGYMSAANGVPRSVKQLLGGVEGSVLDTYKGEFKWDRWTVSLLSARGIAKDLTIRYGVDLTDYKEDLDYSESFSSVIPYWNGSGAIVIGDKQTSPNGTYNGRDECIPLDLTDKFQNAPTTEALNDYAKTYVSSSQIGLPKQSISVNFVRLADTKEYENYSRLYQCGLCDSIKVVFPRYGMEGRFKIVKTTYDVLAERYTGMELGTLSTNLSQALGISSKEK